MTEGEETGLVEFELARVGEPFILPDDDLGREWEIHPFLFDAGTREIWPNEVTACPQSASPTEIMCCPVPASGPGTSVESSPLYFRPA
jgi:hypothetical protein